ncbi:MAG: energy transducer TonB [Pseudomonadota bacterium]
MTYDEVTSKERKLSGALALVMHVMFLALLIFGFSWQKKHIDSAMIVELWSDLPPLPQPIAGPPPQIKPPPEPPKPVPKVEPKPPPKAEPKPEPKPDIALQKEKLEKERKQKEVEKKKELEKLETKTRAEKKTREAAALKEKQAKEAEARAAKEKEDALQRVAQEKRTAQTKAMDAYVNGIREKIRRNVVLPPNMQGNPEAQFDVVQIPGGEVLNVTLKRSSGIAAYDEAVERAIRKASPLPSPPAGVAFSEVRELNLKFRPKE